MRKISYLIRRVFRSWVVIAILHFAMTGGGLLRAQSPLQFAGEPSWFVQNGNCKFSLENGARIVNTAPTDQLSGSLRFVLWLTADPFPSPGYPISIADLGQLQGGYLFEDASTSAPVVTPSVTGFHYFTLALEEFIGAGFFTHYARRSEVFYLRQGVVGPPPLWKPPTGRVIPAPVEKAAGMKVVFIQKAVQNGGKVHVIPKVDQFSISAKLGRSGRTVVYGGSRPNGFGADWYYKKGRAKWSGKTYTVGVLVIDHGVIQGKRVKSTYWLFFQKNGRGFFKGTHADGSRSFTNWGLFTLG